MALLAGRIAVVTGGAQGLGLAIARQFIDDGARVVLGDLNLDATAAAASELGGPKVAHAVRCDVTSAAEVDALIAGALEHFGGCDVMVNNAGITRDATLRKMDKAQWDAVIGVNLDSVFNLCRHAVDGMQARGFGRIVNISSVSGQTGNFGQVNYAAAKAGLHGFSMSLAREVARKGVTVNSVSPGYVETPMTRAMPDEVRERTVASVPVGRIGQPADIARAVAFLTADDAGYITGANVPVNGGLFMSF